MKESLQGWPQHVLLCIPDISLCTKVSDSYVSGEGYGDNPFKQLKGHGGRHGNVEGEEVTPEPPDVDDAYKDFAYWIGDKKTVRKVDEPIIVVAFEPQKAVYGSPEKGLAPDIVGNLDVGVLGAYLSWM